MLWLWKSYLVRWYRVVFTNNKKANHARWKLAQRDNCSFQQNSDPQNLTSKVRPNSESDCSILASPLLLNFSTLFYTSFSFNFITDYSVPCCWIFFQKFTVVQQAINSHFLKILWFITSPCTNCILIWENSILFISYTIQNFPITRHVSHPLDDRHLAKLFDFIRVIKRSDKAQRSISLSLCNFSPPWFLGPKIFLTNLFSYTPNLSSSLKIRVKLYPITKEQTKF
jgi:hypothetical protein